MDKLLPRAGFDLGGELSTFLYHTLTTDGQLFDSFDKYPAKPVPNLRTVLVYVLLVVFLYVPLVWFNVLKETVTNNFQY